MENNEMEELFIQNILKINSIEEELEMEKEEYEKIQIELDREQFKEKNKKIKYAEKQRIFNYDIKNLYPTIFHDFFVQQTIKKIPVLFMHKFPIFLFLNGKKPNGENNDIDLLNTDGAFDLFLLLEKAHNLFGDTNNNEENNNDNDDNNEEETIDSFINELEDDAMIEFIYSFLDFIEKCEFNYCNENTLQKFMQKTQYSIFNEKK